MGIVTARLHGAAARGWEEGILFCGNWGLTRGAVGFRLPALGCIRVVGFRHDDVDVFEDAALGDGDDAVGLDEVVAGFAGLLTAEAVDEAERRAEDASVDGETGAVGLPGVRFAGVVVESRGDIVVDLGFVLLFVLGHSRFTGEGA